MPKVSIGLPVYNGEAFLARAIESVLAQDFHDFELIVADNDSTDSSREIASRYAAGDERISLITSDTNRGAAWNFNRCVEAATGEYFKWSAHDDELEPTWLSECVAALDADPGVILAYTKAVGIDETGTLVRDYRLRPYATADSAAARVRSVLLHPSPCLEAFGLARREILSATSLIGAFTGSDRVLIAELALRGRFHEVPETLFRHRVHSGQSLATYADARNRNAWFDASLKGRYSMPRWRLFKEYARAFGSARVPWHARGGSLSVLLLWMVANARVLIREAGAAGLRRTPLRSLRKAEA